MTPLYRAPEIFLDVTEYTPAIDIWSVGCIFVELLNRAPLFTGNHEMDVIVKIFQLFGKPCFKYNPTKEMKFNRIDYKPKPWSEICPSLDAAGIDLISKMLVLEPEKRITPDEALEHEFFKY